MAQLRVGSVQRFVNGTHNGECLVSYNWVDAPIASGAPRAVLRVSLRQNSRILVRLYFKAFIINSVNRTYFSPTLGAVR